MIGAGTAGDVPGWAMESKLREAKHRDERPGRDAVHDYAIDESDSSHRRRPKIRCPKCAWEPRAGDRWGCQCGHIWNTFDTAGRCPECNHQWEDTMCPSCLKWSKHLDWYDDAPEDPKT